MHKLKVNATQCPSLFGANYPTQQRELRCPRGGCQCFPGYLREQQNGHCVAVKQCPGEKSGESLCIEDEECQGPSNICRDGKCHIACLSHSNCPNSAFCGNDGHCQLPFRVGDEQ
ncbi:hypothetical protein GPALN_005118 [Globodera pallida]|nr:hypothetical protein GPALN_005118 [Globodera pallida]